MYICYMKNIITCFYTIVLLLSVQSQTHSQTLTRTEDIKYVFVIQHRNETNIKRFEQEINEYRQSHNSQLVYLKHDPNLDKAAYIQAEDNFKMRRAGHEHSNPTINSSLNNKLRAAGLGHKASEYGVLGETCYKNVNYTIKTTYNTERSIIEAYHSSPRHREMLLDTDFNRFGVYTISDDEIIISVLFFAK
jgi:uncharacterized protein YkwD